jgi:stage III sporulation protein SpoIIIAA
MTDVRTDEIHLLVATLPEALQRAVEALPQEQLLEVVLDLGRPPQARLPGRAVGLSPDAVNRAALDRVVGAVGEFGADNRAGIEGTLHRIAAIRNRRGEIVGLTLRVGRAVFGTIDRIRDLVEGGHSVLLLGRPGVGKTTRLREMARVLADDLGKRVVVVDTSNEIGGDGDVPHPAIGSARRMQVPHPNRQHMVMIEAVENHMPEVIIVDEIGTSSEAVAARTIAERGVQLIGTAHGITLENLLLNPTLSDLVGGVQVVTLSDEEARLRGTQKTVRERAAPPTFDALVEIVDRERDLVHRDTARAVDRLLRGQDPRGEPRGSEAATPPRPARSPAPSTGRDTERRGRPLQIYPYAISPDVLHRAVRELPVDAEVTGRPAAADLVVALRARRDDPRLARILGGRDVPVHAVKKNSTPQVRRLLQNVLHLVHGFSPGEVSEAVQETESAVRQVLDEGREVVLAPRPAALRKVQHQIVARHLLVAESVGSEPHRRLVIQPPL